MEKQGDEFYKKATETINQTNWFFWGPSKSEKTNLAIEYYIKAGNQYKMAKCNEKAGDAFNNAGKLYQNNKYEYFGASSNYIKAAEMYRNINNVNTQEALNSSTKLLLDNGKFSSAAKNLKMSGEIYEKELNLENAISAYNKAFEYFTMDKYISEAYICLEKTTNLMVEIGNYKDGYENLKKLMEYNISLQYSIYYRKYIFDMIVIQLFLDDIVECNKLCNQIEIAKPECKKIMEYIVIKSIIAAYEEVDSEEFDITYNRYNMIHPLKSWHKKLLSYVKDRIEHQEEDDDFR
jgi:tetratricopeptide (TPR) repeat protein